jgi:hypothetical protein
MRFCYVRYCTLLEVQDYWQNEEDGDAQQKMVAGQESPFLHPPHSYVNSYPLVVSNGNL